MVRNRGHFGYGTGQLYPCFAVVTKLFALWAHVAGPCPGPYEQCGAPTCCRVKENHGIHWHATCIVQWWNQRVVWRSRARRAQRAYQALKAMEGDSPVSWQEFGP